MNNPLDVLLDSGLAIVTLNRGDVGNPLNFELLNSLKNELEALSDNPDVRVILLRSNSSRFCTGMDFVSLREKPDDPDIFRNAIELYSSVLTILYAGSKPTICVVNGEVKAGGVGIVCACDIVIASPAAEFCLSEVLFGLIPANVMPYLLGYRITPQKARYLILTSKTIHAADAQAIGIVDETAEERDLEKVLKGHVRRLLRSSPSALAELKRFTDEVSGGKDETRALAVEKLMSLMQNDEVLAAIDAYKNGETPQWFARFKPVHPLFLEKHS
jgi:enoyl-CoA hydratase/carnithine racemase